MLTGGATSATSPHDCVEISIGPIVVGSGRRIPDTPGSRHPLGGTGVDECPEGGRGVHDK